MSLTLEVVSQQARMLGKAKEMTFGQAGGTIGRSLEADWPLPDGQCYLSNRHASIDFRSGSYYIVDMSKNGVFVNDSDTPVGRGKPQRLFPGDRIRIGDYEMLVTIEGVDDALLDSSHIDPVDARERVQAPSPTGIDLIDANAMATAAEEIILELERSQPLELIPELPASSTPQARTTPPAPRRPVQPAPRPASPPPGTQATNPGARPVAPVTPDPLMQDVSAQAQAQAQARARARSARAGTRPVAASAPAASNGAQAALDAFFQGAGIPRPEMSDAQAEQLMGQLGEVTREFIRGMIECLRFRAIQKAQLKQADTIIQPVENNRLKFSPNFEEGFARLFLDRSDAYLSPTDSVRAAFADIKGHQAAMLRGMSAALSEYLDRLEPREVEERAGNGRKTSLLQSSSKAKYWDLYKDVYSLLAARPDNGLPQPFLDALASAYEKGTKNTKQKPVSRQENA